MYVQWHGISIVETLQADKATQDGGDNVSTCQEQTATVCDSLQNYARDAIFEESF